MAGYCMIENFEVHRNEKFLKIAENLCPKLWETQIDPICLIQTDQGSCGELHISERETMEMLPEKILKRDDAVLLDFGDHYVGYVSLDLSYFGSHPDAPAYIYLRFAERLDELDADISGYHGWLSKSWIQEEYVHVDVLPAKLELPRRYAFRYLKIKVIDVTRKYSLKIDKVSIRAVSAVRMEDADGIEKRTDDPQLIRIDQVSRRTLHNCMQLVFEDGPKRDQRMWLGDLRLQARANYVTFRNTDLVKRCLYLFGGLTFNEGKIPACIFLLPTPEPDDTYLFDYSLMYVSTLLDYYNETKDIETVKDLYAVAIRQIEIALSYLDENNVIPDHSGEFWCFVDWGDNLNTQAASLAILIYSMGYGVRLAKMIGDEDMVRKLDEKSAELKESAIKNFWDEKKGLFTSGKDRQISWATQVWMILARIFPKEKNREILLKIREVNPEYPMVSPYMNHHYIDALIRSGEMDIAMDRIRFYWGGMVELGADTFWEIYNPENKDESPYDLVALNSFCHAWSCTPTYFLRKFYLNASSYMLD